MLQKVYLCLQSHLKRWGGTYLVRFIRKMWSPSHDPVIGITCFLADPLELVPPHPFNWGQKQVQFLKCCVLSEYWTSHRVQKLRYPEYKHEPRIWSVNQMHPELSVCSLRFHISVHLTCWQLSSFSRHVRMLSSNARTDLQDTLKLVLRLWSSVIFHWPVFVFYLLIYTKEVLN
jgi:hypothetical protein